MNQRKRITLQTDVNATCAIRHTLALSVLGLGFLRFREETNEKPIKNQRKTNEKNSLLPEPRQVQGGD